MKESEIGNREKRRAGRGSAATERNCRHYKFDMLFSSPRHSQGVLRHFGAERRVNRGRGRNKMSCDVMERCSSGETDVSQTIQTVKLA